MKISHLLHVSTLGVLLPLTALSPLSGCAAETTAVQSAKATTTVATTTVAKTSADETTEAQTNADEPVVEPIAQAPEKPAPVTPDPKVDEKPEMPDKVITDADKGKTVTVKVGQRLLVKLGSNPTTGYEWSVAKTDDKLLPSDGETTFDVPDTPIAGAPTVQTLFFQGKGAGKTKLELQYIRPWETDKAPNKTYAVEVVISDESKK